MLLALGFAGVVVASNGSDVDGRFVSRSGSTLRVGDEDFRFVGFNLYDAAATDIYSCSPSTRLDDAALDAAMRGIHDAGGTVVRFWAYQTYTAGGTDFSGVDRVIEAARAHDLRVLPALEDGPGDCSTGPDSVPLDRLGDGTWYSQGYRQPLGDAAMSYRAYAARITHHYRDEPTIVAWSLLNEAETAARDAQGRSALVDFADDVAGVVHAADPHHLVTLGTQANGAPGASGPDFADVYGLPGLDLTEVHDWGHWGSDTEAMPGAAPDGELPSLDQCQALDAPIGCSFAFAHALGKPIVVGEAGIAAATPDERQRRADLFTAKMSAAFADGAAGYLVWQLNTENTDTYAVLIGDDDPLYAVLRSVADTWTSGQ